nr:hypothetical protein [Candidatus Brachybacter algidus]
MFDFIKDVRTKADRDVQSYMPLITEINRNFESYASLTNDELRQKTNEFRGRIKQHLEGIDNDITSLENQAKPQIISMRKKTFSMR